MRFKVLFRRKSDGFSVPDSLDPEIERRFKGEDFDLIHVHHPMMIGDTARYLSWKYHVPLAFTYHTRYEQYLHYVGLSAFKGAMPFYLRRCMKSCDMVFAPAPLMKNYLEEVGIKSRVRVLPTGLSLARGAQLRDADARPHPTVVVARPGSGRSGAGDELGGGACDEASCGRYGAREREREGWEGG